MKVFPMAERSKGSRLYFKMKGRVVDLCVLTYVQVSDIVASAKQDSVY